MIKEVDNGNGFLTVDELIQLEAKVRFISSIVGVTNYCFNQISQGLQNFFFKTENLCIVIIFFSWAEKLIKRKLEGKLRYFLHI